MGVSNYPSFEQVCSQFLKKMVLHKTLIIKHLNSEYILDVYNFIEAKE